MRGFRKYFFSKGRVFFKFENKLTPNGDHILGNNDKNRFNILQILY